LLDIESVENVDNHGFETLIEEWEEKYKYLEERTEGEINEMKGVI
jgi:hypothetical protein